MERRSCAIAHLDADCFYVSAERVRHPHLCGQPVGVLSNQGAFVIAKSYELKAYGVATGTSIWDAQRLCPEAVFIKRDFEWYEVISRKLLAGVHEASPTVEYYSIDELFFDAGDLPQAFSLPLPQAARALQQRILREVRVPVTIGIAPTKMLAKLASDTAKPFGCHVAVSPDEVHRLLQDKPVTEITGIAERSAKRLAPYGIATCQDFARAERRLIRKLLTKKGEDLWWELNGTPVLPILSRRPAHKAIARGGSLGKATEDPERINAWVVRNVERLVEALDYHQVSCEQLSLWLQFKEGMSRAQRASLPEATANFTLLSGTAKQLLQSVWPRGETVSYMHVIAERLSYRHLVQRSLFGGPTPAQQAIARVKRLVNEKLGRFVLRSAATLPLADIYADEANEYDICDIYGKTCF